MSFFEKNLLYIYKYQVYTKLSDAQCIGFNQLLLIAFLSIIINFSPCNLSIIPISFNYVLYSKNYRNNSARCYISFLLGNMMLTCFLTLFCISASSLYNSVMFTTSFLSNSLILITSLNLLKLISIPLMNPFATVNNLSNKFQNSNAFFLGVIAALSTSTCNIPIFSTIVSWSLYKYDTIDTIKILLIYNISSIIPIAIIITTSNIARQTPFFDQIYFYCNVIIGSFFLYQSILAILYQSVKAF